MLVATPSQARILPTALAALIALVFLLAIAPSQVGATTATKDSVVSIPLGKSGSGLRVKGVRITAISPGKISKGALRLKVSDVNVTSATKATVILRGGLKLTKARRSVKIQGLMIQANGRNFTIIGKIGNKRLKVLSGRASTQLVASSSQQVVAPAVKVKLGSSTGKAIRSALKLSKSPKGTLGSLVALVKAKLPGSNGPSGAVLQDLAGSPLARPGTAVDVIASPLTSLKWWLRESWVRYIDFSLPQDGAIGDAPSKDTNHVCQDTAAQGVSRTYAINLPFQNGWWDAASQTGAFYYSGAVRWYAPDRGIDITVSGAEIEINGSSSRAIFRFYDASENTLKRGAFLSLNTAAPLNSTPAPGPGGAVSRLKSTIFTDPATSPFGSFVGQYTGNPGWGCFDLAFTA